MKKLMLIAILAATAIGGFYWMAQDNAREQREIYSLLEKQTLTQDEKYRVDGATDPDVSKEAFVVLDEKHAALYVKHFGHKR